LLGSADPATRQQHTQDEQRAMYLANVHQASPRDACNRRTSLAKCTRVFSPIQ
jgi:hypothetical protein